MVYFQSLEVQDFVAEAGKKGCVEAVRHSDGSSPKKTSPGRARALKVELEPSPSLGPSEKVEPEP